MLNVKVIYPYNDHGSKTAMEQFLANCRRQRLDAITDKDYRENAWAYAGYNAIINRADNRVMRGRWWELMKGTDRHILFVLNEWRGFMPCETLALAYLAGFSHPQVSIIVPPHNRNLRCLVDELVADSKDPPPVYERLDNFIGGTMRLAA